MGGVKIMKTEIVKLTQIKLNEANPRIITVDKLDKLINSILVLPKMLELRPIVVDDTFVALGGNMRYRALTIIDDMSLDELAERISELRDYQKKTEAEQQNLIAHWGEWKASPTAPIIKASELSEDERREFVIKDNIGYGDWNMDILTDEWDVTDLNAWGLEMWEWTGKQGGGNDSLNGDVSDKDTTKLIIELRTDIYAKVVDALQAFDQNLSSAIVEALGVGNE